MTHRLQISVLASKMEIGKTLHHKVLLRCFMLLGRWAGQQNCSARGKASPQIPRMEPPTAQRAKPSQIFRVCGRRWPSHPSRFSSTHRSASGLPRLEPLFPQSCEKLCNQIPLASMSDSGDSQSLCWILLRLGSLDVGFRTFTKWENLFWYCSPVCGVTHPVGIGF